MIANLRTLPIIDRIQLVEDLWDSIAADQIILPMTNNQRIELDRRLDIYKMDKFKGRIANEVIADIRKKL